jgi:ATP-dependent Clp protease adaptor protein ClpS
MSETETSISPDSTTIEAERPKVEQPWVVVVWNDPINLMSYVTWVFQKLFNYPRPEAERLMLKVHHDGRAAVAGGSREKAELDCLRLHQHGLWATISSNE